MPSVIESFRPLLVSIAGVAAACPGLAVAQATPPPPVGQLEEVVVTAGLRDVPLAEVTSSVSVLSAATLRDSGVQHLEEVLPQVPGLSWSGATSRPRYFLLRGVGELEQYQGAPNPSIGFLVDDIDFSGLGMLATLYDVEQVEVLRGPQGTRFGANALGGLIKVRTREPGTTREMAAEASVGDDGLRGLGIVAGDGAFGGRGGWRLALQKAQSDGFRENATLGRDDTNGRNETTARFKARYAPTAALGFDLTLLHVDADNGYDAFAIDNSYTTLSDKPGRDAQRSSGASLRSTLALTPAWSLVSITTLADVELEASFDGDWGSNASWGANGPYDFFSRTVRERRTWTEDLRLQSAGEGGTQWTAGAYFSRLRESNAQDDEGLYLSFPYFNELDSRYDAETVALYGEARQRLAAGWRLTIGLRSERRDARYDDTSSLELRGRDTMWGGQVALDRELGPASHAYAAVARGYKAGGFNLGIAVPDGRREFAPESLWNATLGIRGSTASGRGRYDLALFATRRADQQVPTSVQLDPSDPLTFVFLTDNAARGNAHGIEATLGWRAGDALLLEFGGAWMRASYDGYLGDRDWAHAPEFKGSLAATWRRANWFARLDVAGESSFYFDTSHDQRSAGYALTGLRLGYETPRFAAYAWVRNAFDRRYAVRGFYFGNEPPDFPSTLYLRLGDPRQVGVTLRYSPGAN